MTASTRLLSVSPWAGAPSELAPDLGPITVHTPEQIHAARMQVALHGGDQVGELLAMLGLGTL